MKSILLASASVLVLAGAAAAEVTFSGEATLGYNDDSYGDNDGFYWDANLAVTFSQELDNGLTAGATFDFDVADNSNGIDLESGGYVLFLESETASLYFGDTAFAAETHWSSAGDMESDDFSEADGEVALRGDVMFAGIEASISYVVADADGDLVSDASDEDVDQLSVGAVGTFGNFTVGMAYQEEADDAVGFEAANGDFDNDEVFGIFGSTTFGAADITLAYASNETEGEDSIGVEVAYPFGPVTATVYYVEESNGDPNMGLNVAYEDGPIAVELDFQDDQGTNKIGLEGSYDVGNGLVVYAGYLTEDDTEDRYYVGGEYDLGGGASVLMSYAEDEDFVDEDEIGAQEYQNGLTIEAAFEF